VTKTEDGLDFQWTYHNGRDFGEQYINDTKIGIEFTTSFVKVPGPRGGDWAVRVRGRSTTGSDDKIPKISLMFYAGIENQQHGNIALDVDTLPIHRPITGTATLVGQTPETGDFSMSLHERTSQTAFKICLLHF
jgi:mannosyl-oligosaccharide glucosidase